MRKPAFLLFLLLASCAEPPAPPPGRVIVAPGVALDLPPPASLGREIEAVQMVTARHGSQSFTFEAHLSVTNERVLLAGTDGFGQRLMELRWTGEAITSSKASFLPASLQPDYVLADVMLIYWPEAELQQRISGLKVAADGSRKISRAGEDLLTITYRGDPWSGAAHLENHAWDYEIRRPIESGDAMIYLPAMAVASSLGIGKAATVEALFSGQRRPIARIEGLPALPSEFDSRNNRVLSALFGEIGEEIEAAKQRYGAHRIAILAGDQHVGHRRRRKRFGTALGNGRLAGDLSLPASGVG